MVVEYLWTPYESYCFPYSCWLVKAFYSGGPYLWSAPLVYQG